MFDRQRFENLLKAVEAERDIQDRQKLIASYRERLVYDLTLPFEQDADAVTAAIAQLDEMWAALAEEQQRQEEQRHIDALCLEYDRAAEAVNSAESSLFLDEAERMVGHILKQLSASPESEAVIGIRNDCEQLLYHIGEKRKTINRIFPYRG